MTTSQDKKQSSRKLSTWVSFTDLQSQSDELLKLMKRIDVPKVIYKRNEGDIIRELACGKKREDYECSHQYIYGSGIRKVSFNRRQAREAWAKIKRNNKDKLSPVNSYPLNYFYDQTSRESFEDEVTREAKAKLETATASVLAVSEEHNASTEATEKKRHMSSENQEKAVQVAKNTLRQQSIENWNKWVKDHFDNLTRQVRMTNMRSPSPDVDSEADKEEIFSQTADLLLYSMPKFSANEIRPSAGELRQ